MKTAFDSRRGFCATVLGAVVGGVAPIVFVLAYTLCRWLVSGSTSFDRKYDLHALEESLVGPVVGCAAVFAGAAWATFFPVGTYRFVRSLVIVFLLSLPFWLLVLSMELTPRRYKGMAHPLIYLSEMMVLIGPPLVVAMVLSAIRVHSARQEK